MMTGSKRSSILLFFALAIFSYYIVLPILISSSGSSGASIAELLAQTVELIPFGKFLYQFVFNILMGSLGGQVLSYDPGQTLSAAYVTQELTKALFTIIVYEALMIVGKMFTGISVAGGFWGIASKLLYSFVAALVAAYFAPRLMDYIFSSMTSINGTLATAGSLALSVFLLAGGSFFYAALLGVSILSAVLFVVVKILLVSAAKLVATYALLMVVFIGIQYQNYPLVLEGAGTLAAIVIILGGIELAIDAVFGK